MIGVFSGNGLYLKMLKFSLCMLCCLYLYDSVYMIGLLVVVRLLLDIIIRGGCGCLCSLWNSFCVGLDSIRYGVCRIIFFCVLVISVFSCGLVMCWFVSGVLVFLCWCLCGRLVI